MVPALLVVPVLLPALLPASVLPVEGEPLDGVAPLPGDSVPEPFVEPEVVPVDGPDEVGGTVAPPVGVDVPVGAVVPVDGG